MKVATLQVLESSRGPIGGGRGGDHPSGSRPLSPGSQGCVLCPAGLTQLVPQGEAGWAGVPAPPRQRRARLGVFEARSRRPVGDSKTSPGTASRASNRVPRIRVSGADTGDGDPACWRLGAGRGEGILAVLGAKPPLQGSGWSLGSGVAFRRQGGGHQQLESPERDGGHRLSTGP